jgi:hypothetical protein
MFLIGNILCCLFYKYFPLCLGVYVDAIVDTTIHHTQSKTQIRLVSQEQTLKRTDTYKNSFVFVHKSRSPIPKSHFRYKISKCEIHICL